MKFYNILLLGLLVMPSLAMADDAKDQSIAINAAMAEKPAAPKPAEVEEAKPVFTHIGEVETIRSRFEDTLLELGREHNLGYVEMVAANPGIDPWLPGRGTRITLPSKHLIPDVPQEGIVINLAEMRMYDFVTDPDNPKTYPLGIGRDGLDTPLGVTKITRKKEGPTWRPTARMRKEDPTLPEVVPPGEDNPLGTHALYLGWPQYLIHGTHKPLGVGRRVSSGCIRMYPEDIVRVFESIPTWTQVRVIKQPIKMAWIDDMLFLEAHAEGELADSYEFDGKITEYRVPETLFQELADIAGDASDRLDWKTIRDAVKYRRGIPVAILQSRSNNDDITEDVLTTEDEPEVFKTHRFN
jgi:L,D-transpeptidase ErfK/SrfK